MSVVAFEGVQKALNLIRELKAKRDETLARIAEDKKVVGEIDQALSHLNKELSDSGRESAVVDDDDAAAAAVLEEASFQKPHEDRRTRRKLNNIVLLVLNYLKSNGPQTPKLVCEFCKVQHKFTSRLVADGFLQKVDGTLSITPKGENHVFFLTTQGSSMGSLGAPATLVDQEPPTLNGSLEPTP
jgi:predicted transcriptional regulator